MSDVCAHLLVWVGPPPTRRWPARSPRRQRHPPPRCPLPAAQHAVNGNCNAGQHRPQLCTEAAEGLHWHWLERWRFAVPGRCCGLVPRHLGWFQGTWRATWAPQPPVAAEGRPTGPGLVPVNRNTVGLGGGGGGCTTPTTWARRAGRQRAHQRRPAGGRPEAPPTRTPNVKEPPLRWPAVAASRGKHGRPCWRLGCAYAVWHVGGLWGRRLASWQPAWLPRRKARRQQAMHTPHVRRHAYAGRRGGSKPYRLHPIGCNFILGDIFQTQGCIRKDVVLLSHRPQAPGQQGI